MGCAASEVLPEQPRADRPAKCGGFADALQGRVAHAKPQRGLSVFVHLLDDQGNIIAQADQLAPV